MAGKPRIAFFDFTGCEGCQLTVLDLLQTHPELLEAVDIVEFREAMSEKSDDYLIAFVEGSCTRESDEARLKEIRGNAAIVVALGACACMGGVNAIRNHSDLTDVRKYVYADKYEWYETYPVRPISKVVKVDYEIPGCPIDREEFLRVVKELLQGRVPTIPDYPMCVECKANETVCVYMRGKVCLGPIIRAGCGAICPDHGVGCDGCRGLVSDPNIPALMEVIVEHGVSVDETMARMSQFLTYPLMEKEVTYDVD